MHHSAAIHQALLAASIPVVTVRHAQGQYTVCYDSTATEEQRTQGDTILADTVARLGSYEGAISQGYLVEPEGFYLAIGEADLIEWTKLINLTREALDMGLITGETPQYIVDKDFVPHAVTTQRLREILLGLGLYYKAVWDLYRT